MITTSHKLSHCDHCEGGMILCVTCGNNTCNAGYGTVDGKPCPDCPDAYMVHDAYQKDPTSVDFVYPREEFKFNKP